VLAAVAGDGLMRTRRPVEAKYRRAARLLGVKEEVEREYPYARTLERLDPARRPPVHLVQPDGVSHERLLGSEILLVDGAIHIGEERLVDIFHLAGLEAEAAGVADLREPAEKALAKLDPVSYDAELAGAIVEEAPHVADDDLVDVEEQRRPLKPGQPLAEKAELHENIGPAMLPAGRRLGEGRRLNAVNEAGRIVRKADEPEGPIHVRLYSIIKAIHVIGAIERTPLKADDIYFHASIIP